MPSSRWMGSYALCDPFPLSSVSTSMPLLLALSGISCARMEPSKAVCVYGVERSPSACRVGLRWVKRARKNLKLLARGIRRLAGRAMASVGVWELLDNVSAFSLSGRSETSAIFSGAFLSFQTTINITRSIVTRVNGPVTAQ